MYLSNHDFGLLLNAVDMAIDQVRGDEQKAFLRMWERLKWEYCPDEDT